MALKALRAVLPLVKHVIGIVAVVERVLLDRIWAPAHGIELAQGPVTEQVGSAGQSKISNGMRIDRLR